MALPSSVSGGSDGPPASTPERRTHLRAAFERPVLIETAQRSITARGVNVCGGGIAVRTDVPLEPGERLSVYFELPVGYAFECTAEVARNQSGVIVLRFLDATKEAVVAVRSFCRISGLMPAVYGPASSVPGVRQG